MESKSLVWSHSHLLLLLVLLMSLLHRCVVHAQPGSTMNLPLAQGLRDSMKASFSVMVAAFLSAFVVMGFFCLYYRHIYNSLLASTRNAAISAAVDACTRRHQEAIDQCPILSYTAARNPQICTSSVDCAICLGEFHDRDKIRLLPRCHHVFHPDCIDHWLYNRLTCPVCRSPLTSPDSADIEAPPPSNPDENGDQSEARQMNSTSRSPELPPAPVGTIRLVESTGTPTTQSRMLDRFPRSHSTGHFLFVAPDETAGGYTVRLLEQERGHIVGANRSESRGSTSSDVVFPRIWSFRMRRWRRGDSETQTDEDSSSSNMPPV